MFDPKKLVELANKIEEEAKKYHIVNVAIAATHQELTEHPFQFIGDYENKDNSFLSLEEHRAFLSFLKTTLSHVGLSFNICSKLKERLDYEKGLQATLGKEFESNIPFIFDTAIPLKELDPNKSFQEQFQERKEKAEKERLNNDQGIKRKLAAKDEDVLNVNDAEAKANIPLSDSEDKKPSWVDKVPNSKRSRVDVDEKKVEDAMAKISSVTNDLNYNELKSLQSMLNVFFSKNKGQHSIG